MAQDVNEDGWTDAVVSSKKQRNIYYSSEVFKPENLLFPVRLFFVLFVFTSWTWTVCDSIYGAILAFLISNAFMIVLGVFAMFAYEKHSSLTSSMVHEFTLVYLIFLWVSCLLLLKDTKSPLSYINQRFTDLIIINLVGYTVLSVWLMWLFKALLTSAKKKDARWIAAWRVHHLIWSVVTLSLTVVSLDAMSQLKTMGNVQ